MPQRDFETYTPIRALPELVGREKELQQIEDAIRDTAQSYIVYVTGPGGLGKTRLVQHVLQNPPVDVSVEMASDLIDLYHTRTHSLAGLIGEILNVLKPFDDFFRAELARSGADKLEAVARAEQEGFTLAEVVSRRKELTVFFLETLNGFTSQKRLVLALDTAERLHESDPAQQALGLTEERLVILDWLLKDFLPHINNVVILIAGRPGPGTLRQALERIGNKQVVTIDLPGLTEEHALAYFEAVAARAALSEDARDARVTESIRRLRKEQRQVAFYCLCDEHNSTLTVRPILLALVIDHLAVAGQPLPAFSGTLNEAKSLTAVQRQEIQEQLGRELVRAIREGRHPGDEVIHTLAWLGKGADVELLSRMPGLNREEVEKALTEIKDLSFVKPRGKRLFLHDEMYVLLRRYALEEMVPREAAVFEILAKYYEQQIDNAREQIAALYAPLAERVAPNPADVIDARTRLQDALAENLHYRLRHDPAEGFQTYFRYAEEAVLAGDESLDMQLRAELMGFLAERDPSSRVAQIDGLRRADVVADSAIRWVKRLVSKEKYDLALSVAKQLRGEQRGLIEAGGDWAQEELRSWEGLALAYRGKAEEAAEKLDAAIKRLEELQVAESDLHRWSATLARAHNNRGYVARVQSQFIQSATSYRKALPYWRFLHMEIEQANTLNNLAFALGLQGEFDTARRCGEDAVGLRRRVGPQGPVVLSLTTLAEIEVYAGHYREAEYYAERALFHSESIGFRRGEGLARLALAALNRFKTEDVLIKEEKRHLLEESLNHGQKAQRIFTTDVPEPEHEIRALYEQAATLRELCRLSVSEGIDPEGIFAKADDYFGRAIAQARERQFWPAYLEAFVGRAWMHYYLAKPQWSEMLVSLEGEIQKRFPQYVITVNQIPKRGPSTILGIFGQLGRLHVLRGVAALDAGNLTKAAQQFTLAFEYDALVAKDFRDVRRAINVVHERLKKLNPSELLTVYTAVADSPGKIVPPQIQKEDLSFWSILEEHFGPYDMFKRLGSPPPTV